MSRGNAVAYCIVAACLTALLLLGSGCAFVESSWHGCDPGASWRGWASEKACVDLAAARQRKS